MRRYTGVRVWHLKHWVGRSAGRGIVGPASVSAEIFALASSIFLVRTDSAWHGVGVHKKHF